MSSDVKPVSVLILEKEYLVACPQEQSAALHEAARHLDEKMREIRAAGKVIGLDRIAVMAALNLTHEMLQERRDKDRVNEAFVDRVRLLQEKIEDALTEEP